ncbi:MAG: alpha/beta fold hydrolase [Flavobacteriales bacterium]
MEKHLLLLHGALADEGQLYTLRDLLSADAVVHVLTFSGHGKNRGEDVPFAMDIFSNEIIDYAKSTDVRLDVFGYSMGGYAALCAASKSDSLGKIIALGTKFDWNGASAAREIQFLNPDIMQEKIPHFAEQLKKMHGEGWKNVVSRTAAMMIELGKSAPLDAKALSEIKNKVMILVGDQDNTAGVEASRKAAMLLPNSSFFVLDKTQHPIEKTNPVALADRIRLFLKG